MGRPPISPQFPLFIYKKSRLRNSRKIQNFQIFLQIFFSAINNLSAEIDLENQMIESQDKKVEEISIKMKSMMEQLLSIYGKICFSKIFIVFY